MILLDYLIEWIVYMILVLSNGTCILDVLVKRNFYLDDFLVYHGESWSFYYF